jgi:hypothetical protein
MPSTPKRDEADDDEIGDTDLDHEPVAPKREKAVEEEAPITSPAASRDTERDLGPPDSRSVTAKSRVMKSTKEGKESKSGKESKEDTLLSVDEERATEPSEPSSVDDPNPAVEELERRLLQLEARTKVLEMQRGERPAEDRRWLFWVGLLFALALGWQLRAFFE